MKAAEKITAEKPTGKVFEELKAQYVKKTPKSKEAFERAKEVLPGGVTYALRFYSPYPFFVTRSSGSRLFDLDGNAYTDYWLGHGGLILGHSPKVVVDAVTDQVKKGIQFGLCHELETENAKLISQCIPSAQTVSFTNTGTEANMYMVRLARAYTRKMLIGKFEGNWHGGYDALHTAMRPPFKVPEFGGLSQKMLSETVPLPWNDLEGTRKIVNEHEHDLACLVLEPIMGGGGYLTPDIEFLKGLRELCSSKGILLVFDEVVTGFRITIGGAQKLYGIIPDLTTLGKIPGGGFPIGGVCGRSDVMEYFDHLKHPSGLERAAIGGTYVGNPISMRAGIVTLRELQKGKVHNYIDSLGEKARKGIREVFGRSKIKAHVTGLGSVFGVHFTEKAPRDIRTSSTANFDLAGKYFTYMIAHGVLYLNPGIPHMLISNAHTERDIDKLISLTEGFVKIFD
jgi:glutamate-1-semialdehyde 2,1-aminomutase